MITPVARCDRCGHTWIWKRAPPRCKKCWSRNQVRVLSTDELEQVYDQRYPPFMSLSSAPMLAPPPSTGEHSSLPPAGTGRAQVAEGNLPMGPASTPSSMRTPGPLFSRESVVKEVHRSPYMGPGPETPPPKPAPPPKPDPGVPLARVVQALKRGNWHYRTKVEQFAFLREWLRENGFTVSPGEVDEIRERAIEEISVQCRNWEGQR